ncbi:apolipoprotein N-acyltransferase [Thioclava sp. ES.031]|uniref:nitrilase-related carbon-nitrogen hydrolase n=1 Tax=Thioclava sp. ES.031 TaxID=1798203 RepID=UPI000BF8AF50|nr:nitrilase-related carbon-nitrogen hydrolase [Thioclava sp. ES.031]PFG62259.1 apolipoprotein N-acyltransferase [Thioclava sp. ES.031]
MSIARGIGQKPSAVTASLLFVAGFGLFMFCRRSDFLPMIPAMIVVAPILILRFSRTLPFWRSVLLTTLGFVLAFNISLWGIFDMGDPKISLIFNIVRSTMIALLYVIPYWIDRAITPRLGNGLHTTLVFPAAVTALMFLSSIVPPLNGTQAKNVFATAPLPLLQIYALAGLWGFVFLWSWLAAMVNYAWERSFARRPTLVAGVALIAVFGALFAWGGVRLMTAPETPTVRVAAVVMPAEEGGPESMVQVFDDRMTSPYAPTMARIRAMTAEAAQDGAQIVAFNEFAIVVSADDNERARAEFARIAADNHVWLAIPYAWVPKTGKGENRQMLFDDTGNIRVDYQKRFLLGLGDMGETGVFVKGPEVIQTADSPFGRIAVAICRDMSFPRFALQAGRVGADIMLTGSHEFPKGITLNDPYRAVENGFTHIRPTYDGITYAMDPYGRILGQMDRGIGQAGIMMVDVPMEGVRTLYGRFGDWLGWLSVGLVGLFGMGAVIFGRRARTD